MSLDDSWSPDFENMSCHTLMTHYVKYIVTEAKMRGNSSSNDSYSYLQIDKLDGAGEPLQLSSGHNSPTPQISKMRSCIYSCFTAATVRLGEYAADKQQYLTKQQTGAPNRHRVRVLRKRRDLEQQDPASRDIVLDDKFSKYLKRPRSNHPALAHEVEPIGEDEAEEELHIVSQATTSTTDSLNPQEMRQLGQGGRPASKEF